MKNSGLIRSVSLAVILWIHWISISADIELCEKGDGFKIVSIFNLRSDIIIQSRDHNQKEETTFWRLNDTESGTEDKLIPKVVNLRRFEKKFISEEYAIIDENKRIFGYNTPVNGSETCDPKQGSTDCVYDQEEFQEFANSPDKSFICLHGMKMTFTSINLNIPIIKVYKYDSIKLEITPLTTPGLEDTLVKRCMPYEMIAFEKKQPHILNPRLVSMVNWPEFDIFFPDYANISLMEYENEQGNLTDSVKVMSLELGNGAPIETWWDFSLHRTWWFNIFRYNYYYKYMSCGEECTLDSRLGWIALNNINENKSSLELQHVHVNMTLRKLFGCRPHLVDTQQNSFCDKKRDFLSILNLGKDVYFQSSGRFWRYSDNRFTPHSNPLLDSGNKYQIHMESEMSGLLEKNNFDTTFTIFGFTFIAPFFESCEENDQECQDDHFNSGSHYRTCLYGKSTKVQEIRVPSFQIDAMYAFYYTPEGLVEFSPTGSSFEKTFKFCDFLWGRPTMASVASFSSEHYNHISIFYEHIEWKKSVVRTARWPKTKFPLTYNDTERSLDYPEVSNEIKSIFFFQGLLYEYSRRETRNGIARLDRKPHINHYTFFNCPFDNEASYIPMKKERVCNKNERNVAESVFSIGNRHYHQIGQNIYVFDDKKRRFLYDGYSSQLLNVYFDTTHRLTGYSVAYEPNIFDVLIHGKSSPNFEGLGKYIFALFNFDQNYPFLEVIKEKDFSGLKTTNTIGVLVESIVELGFIDYMGYLPSLVVWIQYNKTEAVYSYMRDENVTDLFTPGYKWRFTRTKLPDVPYERILGMYTGKDSQLYLVAHPKATPNQTVVYLIGSDPDIGAMNSFREVYDYHFRHCPAPGLSASESKSSSKTLNTIFAIILIILMIVSLIIAFVVHNNNKNQQKEGTHPIEEEFVETLDPNRPNYTVIRHNDPKQDTSNSKAKTEGSDDNSVRSE